MATRERLDVPALEQWLWDAACEIRGPRVSKGHDGVERLDAGELSASELTALAQTGLKAERMGLGLTFEGARGAFVISPQDVQQLVAGIVDIAVELLPPDTLRLFVSGVYRLIGGDPAELFPDSDVIEGRVEWDGCGVGGQDRAGYERACGRPSVR